MPQKWRKQQRASTDRGDEQKDIQERYQIELPKPGQIWTPPSCYIDPESGKPIKGKVTAELPSDGSIETAYSFYELPLAQATFDGLKKFPTMTKIQFLTLPHALQGRDVIAEAATGGGKTLCFVIPILEAMAREDWQREDGCFALIMTPTRELAMQIFEVIATFKSHKEFSCMAVFGGKHMVEEQSRIEHMGIVVGTPGRLLNHLDETYSLKIDNCRMVILDEADKLVELGFLETTEKILDCLPAKSHRQNLFFSATLKGAVRLLAKKFCRIECCEKISENFEGVSLTKAKNLHHSFVTVPNVRDKINYLYALLCDNFKKKVIVFCSTIKQVRFLYETFTELKTGAKILEIHGSQDQGKRLDMFEEFGRRKAAICMITTDLLGRGIDFPEVELIIQFDCPPDGATYTHRAGRTARGINSEGRSILFLNKSEEAFLKRLKEKGVELHDDVKVRVKRDLTPSLRALCAKSGDIKHLATKAIQSYIKSYSIMKDTQIFNLQAILSCRSGLAASYGLVSAPPLPPGISATIDDDENPSTTTTTTTADESENEELDGGIKNNETNSKQKNMSKLERLKEKIAQKKAAKAAASEAVVVDESEAEEEGHKPKLSRREKRRLRMQELRHMGTAELLKDTDEKLIVTEASPDHSQVETITEENWRDNEQVQKALRKKRLVIRADGTAKLKGAARLIPTKHLYYGSDDEEGADMSTFAGVMKMMNSKEDNDEPIESREERLERLRKKLKQEKEEKANKRRRKERKRKAESSEEEAESEEAAEAIDEAALEARLQAELEL